MVSNLSSLFLVFLLFAATSYAIPVAQLNALCKQTADPNFCLSLLNPSNPNATLVDLTRYSIDIAQANITETIKYINVLIAKSTDPAAKNHYKSCLQHYGSEGALDDIKYTQELLKKGDYQGVRVAIDSVRSDVDDCISGDSPPDPPYKDPSMLPHYAAILDLVVDIIIVLSKSLFR